MRIGKLRKRADSLAHDAWIERRRCEARASNSLSILRRGIGSPAGLAIAFSLGFMAGSRPRRKPEQGDGEHEKRRSADLTGTVVESGARLLTAVAVKSLLSGDKGASEADAESQNV